MDMMQFREYGPQSHGFGYELLEEVDEGLEGDEKANEV